MSPFEVAIGFQPRTPLDVLVTEQPGRSVSSVAYKFAKSRQGQRQKTFAIRARGDGSIEANSSNLEEDQI